MFGGTGAIGIEALSQGAAECIFLDTSAQAVKTIRTNLETTRLASQAEVRHTDAFVYLKNTSRAFDLIIVAPPQYKGIWVEAITLLAERPALLNPHAQVIIQIDPKEYEELLFSYFEGG